MFSRELLRIRSFRDLWLGQAISQLGDSLYYIAFMFMAKQVTGSAAMVGYVGALEALPFLLFGPYAGVLADRMDRRKIMLVSDWVCALVLLSFAVTVVAFGGRPPVWSLLTVPFLLSSVRVFFLPAKSAAIPALVPQPLLMKANALSASTFNIVFLMGLALGATVIGELYNVSTQWFFAATLALNSISFIGSALFIARMPAVLPDRDDAHEKHPWEDFKAGVGYIRRRSDLKTITFLLAAFRLCVAPFFVAYVEVNDRWFDGHPRTLTWFEFSFFVGMIVGSWWIAKIRVERPTRFFMFGLALVGVFVAAMGVSPVFWLFIAWNLLCGVSVPFADIPIITYLQASVDDAFRGRVNAVREMIGYGVMPIGMVMAGQLVEWVGVSGALLLMGAGMTAAMLVGMFDPQFRNVRMPEGVHEPDKPATDAPILNVA